MLFVTTTVENTELNTINDFFNQFDNEFQAVKTVDSEEITISNASKYITSLVTNQYKKAVADIENTQIGHKKTRKRNLQQIMQESFFNGANRFGNNFIA